MLLSVTGRATSVELILVEGRIILRDNYFVSAKVLILPVVK